MKAEELFLISRISYITAAVSLLLGIIIWYRMGISGIIRELKGRKPAPGRIVQGENEGAEEKTGILAKEAEIEMIDDIVLIHSNERIESNRAGTKPLVSTQTN